MRIQLPDLHLETEAFEAEPNPAAELLVLGGDIDSRWTRWRALPTGRCRVLMVAGNHEFDGRELGEAWSALRTRCGRWASRCWARGRVLTDAAGARIRFVATVRWCDFDLFGDAGRATAMPCRGLLHAQHHAQHPAQRGLRCRGCARGRRWPAREWLAATNWRRRVTGDRTVVLTHFAPSLASADPRYGATTARHGEASAVYDDALLPLASTWIHGHLHCRHDYLAGHAGGRARVVCRARGHARGARRRATTRLRLFEV